jgi:hypothetical protein
MIHLHERLFDVSASLDRLQNECPPFDTCKFFILYLRFGVHRLAGSPRHVCLSLCLFQNVSLALWWSVRLCLCLPKNKRIPELSSLRYDGVCELSCPKRPIVCTIPQLTAKEHTCLCSSSTFQIHPSDHSCSVFCDFKTSKLQRGWVHRHGFLARRSSGYSAC